MTKLNKIIAVGAATLTIFCAAFGTTGCVTLPQTATATISEQTKDPIAVARAAFLDAKKLYNDLGERYIKYVPYMASNYPEQHEQVLYIFAQAHQLLVQWDYLSAQGINPKDAVDYFNEFANAIIVVLSELEKDSL